MRICYGARSTKSTVTKPRKVRRRIHLYRGTDRLEVLEKARTGVGGVYRTHIPESVLLFYDA